MIVLILKTVMRVWAFAYVTRAAYKWINYYCYRVKWQEKRNKLEWPLSRSPIWSKNKPGLTNNRRGYNPHTGALNTRLFSSKLSMGQVQVLAWTLCPPNFQWQGWLEGDAHLFSIACPFGCKSSKKFYDLILTFFVASLHEATENDTTNENIWCV